MLSSQRIKLDRDGLHQETRARPGGMQKDTPSRYDRGSSRMGIMSMHFFDDDGTAGFRE